MDDQDANLNAVAAALCADLAVTALLRAVATHHPALGADVARDLRDALRHLPRAIPEPLRTPAAARLRQLADLAAPPPTPPGAH